MADACEEMQRGLKWIIKDFQDAAEDGVSDIAEGNTAFQFTYHGTPCEVRLGDCKATPPIGRNQYVGPLELRREGEEVTTLYLFANPWAYRPPPSEDDPPELWYATTEDSLNQVRLDFKNLEDFRRLLLVPLRQLPT